MTERPSDSLASLQDFMSNVKFQPSVVQGRTGGPVIPGLNLGAALGDEQSGSKVLTPTADKIKFPTARVPERAR